MIKQTLTYFALTTSISLGVSVNFAFTDAAGGPANGYNIVATSDGVAAGGAVVYAGTFDTAQNLGLTTFEDVQNDFTIFAELNTGASDSFGRFAATTGNGVFDNGGADFTPFSGEKLFLVFLTGATISGDRIAAADEYAVISDTTWVFQGGELEPTPAFRVDSTLEDFAGSTTGTGEVPGIGSLPSIELQAVPEPSSALLGLLGLGLLARRRR